QSLLPFFKTDSVAAPVGLEVFLPLSIETHHTCLPRVPPPQVPVDRDRSPPASMLPLSIRIQECIRPTVISLSRAASDQRSHRRTQHCQIQLFASQRTFQNQRPSHFRRQHTGRLVCAL